MPTLTEDKISKFGIAFSFPAAEAWTVPHHIVVSSWSSVGVYCAFAGAALINHGTILARISDPAGDGRAVFMDAEHTVVTNAVDGYIMGEHCGVFFSYDTTMTNNGVIESYGFGIACGASVPVLDITNTGTIRGGDVGIAAATASGTIRNSGLIDGVHAEAIGGSLFGGALAIFNDAGGIIRGGERAILQFGVQGALLDNLGTLMGDVYLLGSGGNVIRNSGRINGDVILGVGADVFNGTGGRSGAVSGGDGNDTLTGGSLSDWLDGGYGRDALVGRAGTDKFVFSTGFNLGPNVDRITDFAVNQDTIILKSDIFHVGQPGILAAARFHIGAQAADASDRIVYNRNTGAVFYDPDGNGGAPQAKLAQLGKHLALDHADFVVIG